MDAGDPAAAAAALEKIKTPDAHVKAALETARHAAGLAALRAGNGGRAVQLLEAAQKDAAGDEARAVACDLALATVAGGDRDTALRRLRALGTAACPFPAPADTQAVPILIALNEGLRPHAAAKALPRLAKLQRGSTGAARTLLATATRVLALAAADEAYRAGQTAAAERYLAAARAAETRAGADELAHNQAVIDIASGRFEIAIAALEKLGGRVPDSLVNLGIAYDKHGEPDKALDAWRRALKAGSRWPELPAWVAALERIYGSEGGSQ
jgi:tetratricopeptide (TPR) repeat protein